MPEWPVVCRQRQQLEKSSTCVESISIRLRVSSAARGNLRGLAIGEESIQMAIQNSSAWSSFLRGVGCMEGVGDVNKHAQPLETPTGFWHLYGEKNHKSGLITFCETRTGV